jgi:hypothetical protein
LFNSALRSPANWLSEIGVGPRTLPGGGQAREQVIAAEIISQIDMGQEIESLPTCEQTNDVIKRQF